MSHPFVGFEFLTAVSTKMAVFWVVAPCSLVEVYQRFRGACCLHHQGDQGTLKTTRRYNPEDSHLHIRSLSESEFNDMLKNNSVLVPCSAEPVEILKRPVIVCIVCGVY
jgi:hypothetical protein